ncbi:MAG: Flp pilus assembly protein CpaB [Alphaproteobacteria bacterium]|nr:Flp pilus assembly protein CpaB [Alphaproteobacteria bacterium]
MRARTLILLAFAVIAAGGTFYLAQNWIATQRGALTRVAKQDAPQATSTVLVLVANKELPAGRFIKAKDLRWQAWPEKGLSETYYVKGKPAPKRKNAASGDKSKDKSKDAKASGKGLIADFVGAVVRAKITPGEPITDGRVVRPGDRGFLAAVLQPGTRAISVPINATTGISGFVFPGDKVDMLLTHSIQEEDETVRRATETVLSDIRVLAVDQRTDDVEGKAVVAKTATLEVTPKQAEVIAVASEIGRLSLSLRSLAKEDEKVVTLRKARTFTWDTEASHLLPRRTKNKNAHVVKVFRGGSATAREFDKQSSGGYSPKGTAAKIQPAAKQTAVGTGSVPKNLIGKVK